MNAWTLKPRTLLSAALLAAMAASCTLRVGSGDGGFSDTDDIGLTDKSDAPDSGDSDTASTSDEPTSTGSDTSASSSSADTSSSDATTDTTPTSSDEPTSTSSDTSSTQTTTTTDVPPTPPAMMCPGEAEQGSCEECVQLSCFDEWDACCGTSCAPEWSSIQDCMIETATEDALADFDRCSEQASPTGDALDLQDATLALRDCVAAEFMGDPDMDPLMRASGDGTCTFACFYVQTLY